MDHIERDERDTLVLHEDLDEVNVWDKKKSIVTINQFSIVYTIHFFINYPDSCWWIIPKNVEL